MPKGSKVDEVEGKLKKEYGEESKEAKAKVYGTLNKIGLMHGNKVTAKGKQKAKAKTVLG
jgi:hypothetical protein